MTDEWQFLRSRAFITIPEAARLLQISPETGYRWAREGRLPGAVRLGSAVVRVRTEVLAAAIEGTSTSPDNVPDEPCNQAVQQCAP